MYPRTSTLLVLLSILLLGAPAARAAGTAAEVFERPQPGDEISAQAAETDDGVLVTVALADGTEVRFIDERLSGADGVGVMVTSPTDVPSAAAGEIARRQLSPLELFLTLTPEGTEIPERLIEDHRMRTGEDPGKAEAGEPLAAAPVLPQPSNLQYDGGFCTNAGFHSSFSSIWPIVVLHTHMHQGGLSGSLNMVTPGATARKLGVCFTNGAGTIAEQVEFWNGSAWKYVAGTARSLIQNQFTIYYSSSTSFQQYRMRVFAAPGKTWRGEASWVRPELTL